MKRQVNYYSDELNDEFAGDSIIPRRIDEHYPYIRDSLGQKLLHFFWYRIVAIPLAWLGMKLCFHHRIVGREKLRELKGSGYVVYGNHTHNVCDALIPTMACMPKKVSVIVHANNVSMKGLGRITPYLGALPLPDDQKAAAHFIQAIRRELAEKHCVMIYPEAHIWPYYTGIRPFKDASFRYPVQENVPIFCLTNTYQKRRFSSRPKIVTYIDGPCYPDARLSPIQRRRALRNWAYAAMCRRAELNTVERIRYVKKEVNGE